MSSAVWSERSKNSLIASTANEPTTDFGIPPILTGDSRGVNCSAARLWNTRNAVPRFKRCGNVSLFAAPPPFQAIPAKILGRRNFEHLNLRFSGQFLCQPPLPGLVFEGHIFL